MTDARFEKSTTASILLKWTLRGNEVCRWCDGDKDNSESDNVLLVPIEEAMAHFPNSGVTPDGWCTDWDSGLTDDEKELVMCAAWRRDNFDIAQDLMSVNVITSVEQLRAEHNHTASCILVQVGSPQCPLCIPFGLEMNKLAASYQVERMYCDAFESPDVTEEFNISKLPAAIVCMRGKEPLVLNNSTPNELASTIRSLCTPVFSTDAEF